MIQADALIAGGNIPAAIACFEQARELAVEYLPERVWEVDSRRASWAANLGEPAFGAEVNLELLRDPGHAADKWETGSLLHNAADALRTWGNTERRSHTSKRRARSGSRSIMIAPSVLLGPSRQICSVGWATWRERARRWPRRPTCGPGLRIGAYQVCAARLALDCADYTEAASLARKAVAVPVRVHTDPKREVAVALLAVEALCAAGHFREARKDLMQASRVCLSKLDAFCDWKSSDNTRLADEHAARAVRIMVAGQGSDSARLQAAREHLEMATSFDPAFGWFHLELAFVDFGQGRQRQAIRRLADAARLTDDTTLRKGIDQMRDEFEKPSSGNQ